LQIPVLRPPGSPSAGLQCGRLKVGCGKDTNWLLFDPNELERFAHQKGGIKKFSLSPAPSLRRWPFAQTHSTGKKHRTATEQPIMVTAPIITTTEEGSTSSSVAGMNKKAILITHRF